MSDALKKPWWGYIVVGAYAVLQIVMLPAHEPWFDEAQAWLLARDASLPDLFGRILRYEGTPCLWYLILMLPAKLNFPYITLNIISILLAVIGAYLVVIHSPFPAIIKTLLPFTYFVFYQYAVVARNYVLFPVILSLIAIVYKRRKRRPYLFAILLMLLSLVSVHGFLVALGLMAVEALDALKGWKKSERREKLGYVKLALIFGAFSVLNALILAPPKDSSSLTRFNFDPVNYLRVGARVVYEIISGGRIPSILLFTVLLLWLWHKGRLLVFAATTIPVISLFAFTWVFNHHMGVIFFALIFSLWLSFESYKPGDWKSAPNLTVLTALVIIFSFHLYWTIGAFRYDFSEKYSASRDVANYLKANNSEDLKLAAVGNRALAILPYFDKNIFTNFNDGQKPCHWIWAKNYNTNVWTYQDMTADSMHSKATLAARDKPDLIVASVLGEYDPSNMPLPGYKFTKLFPARVYWRDKAGEQESFAIFTREPEKTQAITDPKNQ